MEPRSVFLLFFLFLASTLQGVPHLLGIYMKVKLSHYLFFLFPRSFWNFFLSSLNRWPHQRIPKFVENHSKRGETVTGRGKNGLLHAVSVLAECWKHHSSEWWWPVAIPLNRESSRVCCWLFYCSRTCWRQGSTRSFPSSCSGSQTASCCSTHDRDYFSRHSTHCCLPVFSKPALSIILCVILLFYLQLAAGASVFSIHSILNQIKKAEGGCQENAAL